MLQREKSEEGKLGLGGLSFGWHRHNAPKPAPKPPSPGNTSECCSPSGVQRLLRLSSKSKGSWEEPFYSQDLFHFWLELCAWRPACSKSQNLNCGNILEINDCATQERLVGQTWVSLLRVVTETVEKSLQRCPWSSDLRMGIDLHKETRGDFGQLGVF